jgi:hypothetical protein
MEYMVSKIGKRRHSKNQGIDIAINIYICGLIYIQKDAGRKWEECA